MTIMAGWSEGRHAGGAVEFWLSMQRKRAEEGRVAQCCTLDESERCRAVGAWSVVRVVTHYWSCTWEWGASRQWRRIKRDVGPLGRYERRGTGGACWCVGKLSGLRCCKGRAMSTVRASWRLVPGEGLQVQDVFRPPPRLWDP